jgi:hypothetical protein
VYVGCILTWVAVAAAVIYANLRTFLGRWVCLDVLFKYESTAVIVTADVQPVREVGTHHVAF